MPFGRHDFLRQGKACHRSWNRERPGLRCVRCLTALLVSVFPEAFGYPFRPFGRQDAEERLYVRCPTGRILGQGHSEESFHLEPNPPLKIFLCREELERPFHHRRRLVPLLALQGGNNIGATIEKGVPDRELGEPEMGEVIVPKPQPEADEAEGIHVRPSRRLERELSVMPFRGIPRFRAREPDEVVVCAIPREAKVGHHHGAGLGYCEGMVRPIDHAGLIVWVEVQKDIARVDVAVDDTCGRITIRTIGPRR